MSDEAFRARLRRIRREERGEEAGAEERERGLPAWFRERVAPGGKPDGSGAGAGAGSELPPRDLEVEDPGEGEIAMRTRRFPPDHRHGDFRLDEIDAADPDDFALLTGDGRLGDLALAEAVYLDTETTGLSGGAGTYVFLIGLGRFTADGFELWQGFLREPSEERALLAECARRIGRSAGVVSFFGKSFDRHRLEDKMRLCGLTPPFAELPHLDLYHPCRRLYGAALPDGRLSTVEIELCGVAREDDLPGSYAPAAWFDFLAGRPHRLEDVFRHNADDVLSLVTLAAHVGRSREGTRRDGAPLAGDGASRAAGLARSFRGVGDRRGALAWIERALEGEGGARRDWLAQRAEHLRLLGERDAALEAYRELVVGPEDRHTAPSLLELAKLLEHHRRDLAGAAECCEIAREALERNHVGPEYARLSRDLEKRLARVRRGR